MCEVSDPRQSHQTKPSELSFVPALQGEIRANGVCEGSEDRDPWEAAPGRAPNHGGDPGAIVFLNHLYG